MVTWVTGASRGIGAATVAALREQGEVVVGFSRSPAPSPWQHVDITDRQAVFRAFSLSALRHGRPTALVHCAAMAITPRPFTQIGQREWNAVVDTNLLGTVHVLGAYLEQCEAGKMVLVASTAGMRPSPDWTAYAATKAAVISIAQTLEHELAGSQHVYCVAPARTATELRRVLAPDEDPVTIQQPAQVADVICRILSGDLESDEPIVVRDGVAWL